MKEHLIIERNTGDLTVFVLQGIGGAGKSEAAIKFATDNQHRFVPASHNEQHLLTD